jgi:hypothetical protein
MTLNKIVTMKTKRITSLLWIFLILPVVLLISVDPTYANKFETIGGGVQGSNKVKIEYLQIITYVASGFFMIAGILSIVLHNRNSHTLNYTMWKSSAAIFFLMSIAMVVAGFYMS